MFVAWWCGMGTVFQWRGWRPGWDSGYNHYKLPNFWGCLSQDRVFPLPCNLINASILWLGELKLPFHRWGHGGLEKQSGAHSELVRTIQTWAGAPQKPSQRAPVCWWHHTSGRLLDVHGTCWVSIINYPELISVLIWWWGPMILLEDLTYINRSWSLHVTRWPSGDHGKHH